MSDYIEIDHPPKIWDDSEKCGDSYKKTCRNIDDDDCSIFGAELSFDEWYLKCDECKTAWKKAKSEIKPSVELPEGDFQP